MVTPYPGKRSLRTILDKTTRGNKDDIAVCLTGHLNSSNLLRLKPEPNHHTTWKAATEPNPPLSQRAPPKPTIQHVPPNTELEFPNDEMLQNMLGQIPDYVSGPGFPTSPALELRLKRASSEFERHRDSIWVEELRLPEVMLPLDNSTKHFLPQRLAKLPEILSSRREKEKNAEDALWASASQAPSPGASRASSGREEAEFGDIHIFIPTHVGTITKKDQYTALKAFTESLVRPDEADTSVARQKLTGQETVEKIMRKVKKRLKDIEAEDPSNGQKISFKRIKVFSDAFDEVTSRCAVLAPILHQVKENYETYLTTLLDRSMANAGRTEALAQQAQAMKASSGPNPEPNVLQQLQKKLRNMELTAVKELDRNDRLQKQLRDTRLKLSAGLVIHDSASPLRSPYLKGPSGQPLMRVVSPAAVVLKEEAPEPPSAAVQQVLSYHETIAKQTEEIRGLKHELRTKHVPGAICQQLDRSLKETQYEIEKLEEVKTDVETEMKSLDDALRDWIRLADTSDRDAQRLWMAIDSNCEESDVDLEGDDLRHNEYFS